MSRRFYDSTTATDIPKTARNALGYVDGAFANARAVRAWLGSSLRRLATVTVAGSLNANMADQERGDLTPAEAAKWAHDKRAARKGFPTIYTEASTVPDVIAECRKLGLQLWKHYLIFVALYDGDPTIPSYAVGKQYLSPGVAGAESGGHYDVSAVRRYWRGVDPRHLSFLGVRVSRIKRLLSAALAWAKAHPRKAKHELIVFAGLLAAQPAVHALIHGQKTTAAAVIAAVGAAVLAAARKFSA